MNSFFPTTFCCWVYFSPVPECVVADCWNRAFPTPPAAPGPDYCFLLGRFSESRLSLHNDICTNKRFFFWQKNAFWSDFCAKSIFWQKNVFWSDFCTKIRILLQNNVCWSDFWTKVCFIVPNNAFWSDFSKKKTIFDKRMLLETFVFS